MILHAEVIGIDGTQVESESYGIFFADPQKFIPISDAGELLSGQFVEVQSNGTLGAFRYLPEGATAPNQAVGFILSSQPVPASFRRTAAHRKSNSPPAHSFAVATWHPQASAPAHIPFPSVL
jgi:hypothetical protein